MRRSTWCLLVGLALLASTPLLFLWITAVEPEAPAHCRVIGAFLPVVLAPLFFSVAHDERREEEVARVARFVGSVSVLRTADGMPRIGDAFVQEALVEHHWWSGEHVHFPVSTRLVESSGTRVIVRDDRWTAFALEVGHSVRVVGREHAVLYVSGGVHVVSVRGDLPAHVRCYEKVPGARGTREEFHALVHVAADGIAGTSRKIEEPQLFDEITSLVRCGEPAERRRVW